MTQVSKSPKLVTNDPVAWMFWWLRLLLIVAQGLSIFISWRVWNAREFPPNLPLELPVIGELPQFSIGWLLIASLLVILRWPRSGMAIHSAVLVFAMLQDQMRIQPEFVSLAILLWGTLPSASFQLLARAHVISMWFWAGLHKLLCEQYVNSDRGYAVFKLAFPDLSDNTGHFLAMGAAFTEIALAGLAMLWLTRKVAAVLAVCLHLGILLILMIAGWNVVVWPWNIALAVAASLLLWTWKPTFGPVENRCRWSAIVGAVLLLILPFGFYSNRVDAYLAHCLYSVNTPSAYFYPDAEYRREQTEEEKTKKANWSNQQEMREAWLGDVHHVSTLTFATLNVPFPMEQRILEQYFRRIARLGDQLTIIDSRVWAKERNWDKRLLTFDGNFNGEDRREGFWRLRDGNDYITAEGEYVGGLRVGTWTFYRLDGTRELEQEYRKGEAIGEPRYFDARGQPATAPVTDRNSDNPIDIFAP